MLVSSFCRVHTEGERDLGGMFWAARVGRHDLGGAQVTPPRAAHEFLGCAIFAPSLNISTLRR